MSGDEPRDPLLPTTEPTTDPLLCAPEEKAQIEAENCVRQLEAIEYWVEHVGVRHIREGHVLELHKLAVHGIYGCGGTYRTVTRTAKLSGGNATHVPPEPATIPSHVRHALDARVNDESQSVLERAAYALWRFNWIHPFAGGNGRTSRAIAYFALCIDFKKMMPGTPTFPTRIFDRRDEYVKALRVADAAEAAGAEDIFAMIDLVYEAISGQMDAAIATAEARLSAAERRLARIRSRRGT